MRGAHNQVRVRMEDLAQWQRHLVHSTHCGAVLPVRLFPQLATFREAESAPHYPDEIATENVRRRRRRMRRARRVPSRWPSPAATGFGDGGNCSGTFRSHEGDVLSYARRLFRTRRKGKSRGLGRRQSGPGWWRGSARRRPSHPRRRGTAAAACRSRTG